MYKTIVIDKEKLELIGKNRAVSMALHDAKGKMTEMADDIRGNKVLVLNIELQEIESEDRADDNEAKTNTGGKGESGNKTGKGKKPKGKTTKNNKPKQSGGAAGGDKDSDVSKDKTGTDALAPVEDPFKDVIGDKKETDEK